MPVIERTEAAVELRDGVFLAGRAEALVRRLVQREGKDLLLPRRAHVTHGSERRAAEQHRLSRRAGRAAGAVDAAAVETQARLFGRVRAAVRAAVELRSEPRKTHEPQLKDRLDMFGRI